MTRDQCEALDFTTSLSKRARVVVRVAIEVPQVTALRIGLCGTWEMQSDNYLNNPSVGSARYIARGGNRSYKPS